jgi:hypothetical protein
MVDKEERVIGIVTVSGLFFSILLSLSSFYENCLHLLTFSAIRPVGFLQVNEVVCKTFFLAMNL